jgi:hypothetical protein
MVSYRRSGVSWLAMVSPIYLKCKTCKYVKFVSPTQAKCLHFIFLNNPYLSDINHIGEDDLYLDVEVVRNDNGLCGKNATYYTPRLTRELKKKK